MCEAGVLMMITALQGSTAKSAAGQQRLTGNGTCVLSGHL